jgi:hypothetical protein
VTPDDDGAARLAVVRLDGLRPIRLGGRMCGGTAVRKGTLPLRVFLVINDNPCGLIFSSSLYEGIFHIGN